MIISLDRIAEQKLDNSEVFDVYWKIVLQRILPNYIPTSRAGVAVALT